MRQFCPTLLGIGGVALVFAVVAVATAPGIYSPDSLGQLLEAQRGVYSDGHPPLMASLWSLLLRISGHRSILVLAPLLFALVRLCIVRACIPTLRLARRCLAAAPGRLQSCHPELYRRPLEGCRAGCQSGVLFRLRRAVASYSSATDHNAARRACGELLCSWRQVQCSTRLASTVLALVAALLRA